MTTALDAARERLGVALFARWDPQELDDLVRLMCKFAATIEQATAGSQADDGR
jgi:hypothetical protein